MYDWMLFCAIFFPISHNHSPNFSQLQIRWKPVIEAMKNSVRYQEVAIKMVLSSNLLAT